MRNNFEKLTKLSHLEMRSLVIDIAMPCRFTVYLLTRVVFLLVFYNCVLLLLCLANTARFSATIFTATLISLVACIKGVVSGRELRLGVWWGG